VSLPEEKEARADLAQQFNDLFSRSERVHNAAVELLTRGKFVVSKRNPGRGVLTLIASLLTKALKTFRGIQILAEAGLGQDASVLARQLFETAVAVKFILKAETPLRAAMFAAHEDQRLLVIVENAARIGGFPTAGSQETLDKAREKVRVWSEVMPPDALASVRRHWSGHTLEWAAGEVGLLRPYAMMYRFTSGFAHGSDATAHFFVRRGEGVPTLKLMPGGDQVLAVLESAIELMAMIVKAPHETFGLDWDAVIHRIEGELPREGGVA
jgi:hypothetical protein